MDNLVVASVLISKEVSVPSMPDISGYASHSCYRAVMSSYRLYPQALSSMLALQRALIEAWMM